MNLGVYIATKSPIKHVREQGDAATLAEALDHIWAGQVRQPGIRHGTLGQVDPLELLQLADMDKPCVSHTGIGQDQVFQVFGQSYHWILVIHSTFQF